MFQKKIAVLSALMISLFLISCGKSDNSAAEEDTEPKLVGSLSEIMDSIYENADLSQDFRDAMEGFDSGEIPSDSAEYMIGTADVEYTESLYSMPMINVVPYQCILLRVPEGTDMEAAKTTIKDHADPRKWICVEAESVVVENVGDVILFVMADTETANAIRSSFLALAE